MGDFSGNVDVEMLMSFSDDLVGVLKNQKDTNSFTQCFEQLKAFGSSSVAESTDAKDLIEDYQRRIDECKEKTEKARTDIAADDELEFLQKELDVAIEQERSLMEELRVINNEINDLERQRVSVEEHRRTVKKLEQDELRAQRKLSMYASVTTIIPNLDDHSKISGHTVNREKKVVEKFEYDPKAMTSFDTCQDIWKMISSQ